MKYFLEDLGLPLLLLIIGLLSVIYFGCLEQDRIDKREEKLTIIEQKLTKIETQVDKLILELGYTKGEL